MAGSLQAEAVVILLMECQLLVKVEYRAEVLLGEETLKEIIHLRQMQIQAVVLVEVLLGEVILVLEVQVLF